MPLKVLSTASRYEALPPSAVAILGDYEEDGTNHGRTVYRRLNTRRGTVRQAQVYLFYWDDRNGKDMMGWYFGNAIGGGQVWGRCTNLEDETSSSSSQPPQFGWRCPVDGPVQQHIQCVPQGSRAVKHMAPPHDVAPPAKWRKMATCTLTASMAGHSEGEHSAPVAVLLGDYAAVRTNHGRKVFRKASGLKVELWLYYWDDRDGDEMSGWWFGDRVGGEGVYAHAASHGPMPPRIGWRIPHDGVVVPSFTLSVKGARGDADMSVEARMNDAKDLVVKAEATVDSAIGLADQILKGTAEVLEESVEAVRERLEAERTALLEAKASVESHSEACIMSTEMPEATEAELSVLQERLDALLGRLTMELKEADAVLAQQRAAAAAAAAATQRLKEEIEAEAEARDSVAQPLTPPGMFHTDEAAGDDLEDEFLGGLVKPELHQDGGREPAADEAEDEEPEPPEVAAARRLLKPARDSAAKAESWLTELEKMAAPWANGNELVSEAEGSLALDACEVLLAEAEPGLQLSCTFLRDQVEQAKELPFSVPQSKVLEEMVSLMRTVEAAYLKVLEAKVQTAWRRTVLRVPDILGMVVGAEEQVTKLQASAAVLFEDTLDKPELADRLTKASRDVIANEEVCMAACSEAKQAIQQKQKESEVTESPAFSSCISSLEARIEAAEGQIREARQAADTLDDARRSLGSRHEAFAKVDKALNELELLTMPMGDESKSEDEEEGTAKAVASAQDALSEWEESTRSLHKSTSCPALKFALQRLLDAKGPSLHLRLREAVEFVEDWLWNALSRVYAKELQAKFRGMEPVFAELEAAEAPFLKGLEVLSGQQAEETFQACEAAATHANKALEEAARKLDDRCAELRRRAAGCKEASMAEQDGKAPEEGALEGCRAQLRSLTERLEAFKAETEHRKQLATGEV